MRNVVVSEFLTLDGVMQGPGGPDEDREGGFQEGGWQLPYFDEAAGAAVAKGLAQAGGLLLGRRTYEIFAAYWPNQPAGDEFADIMNSVPKHVASTTLEEPLAWNNSTLIHGDVPAGRAQTTNRERLDGHWERQPGSNARTERSRRRVPADDPSTRCRERKRLFEGGGVRVPLKLTASETTGKGVLFLTYQGSG
jgi:hypothetical protein